MTKIALIGGSGVKDSPILTEAPWNSIQTGYCNGYGDGSVDYQKAGEAIFIPRHGYGKVTFGPSKTQYAANLIAARLLGAEIVIATTAVGSLRTQIGLECLVIPNDYVDETRRDDNLYGVGIVVHANPRPAFSEELRDILYKTALENPSRFNGVLKQSTICLIPGDRFGTGAEGKKRANYADLVGMTLCPEASMAMQLGLTYAAMAFVVDDDTHANHEGGTLAIMNSLSRPDRVPQYIADVVEEVRSMKPELLQQLRGNIIPGDLSRIVNPHLNKFAHELIEKYC